MTKKAMTTTKTIIHYNLQYEYKPDGSIDHTKPKFVPSRKTVEITKYEKGDDDV